MTDKQRQALEAARHELTTLHGLTAADGAAPLETWVIDTHAVTAAIDEALMETASDLAAFDVAISEPLYRNSRPS